mgnify:CR=1 FL=1
MSWAVKRIGDFCDTGSGGTPSRSKKHYYNSGNISWVKSGELRGGVITSTEEMITEQALTETCGFGKNTIPNALIFL